MSRKYILGGIAVVALGLFGMMNMKQSITPYVTIKQAQRSHATVQVNGKLVKNSSEYDMKSGMLRFRILDTDGDTMAVEYPKPAPANFKQATGIVLVGEYRGGVFRASELLVKCPSKYERKADK